MPLDLVTTAYGRPALRALRAAVATAKGADLLAPVTVVVPSNHVGVAARRLLASGAAGPPDVGPATRRPGLVGVTFLTPYRLAELLGANRLAAAGRRPVSTPVVAAALRQALAADPGAFAPVAAHPATEAALVAAYGQLADLSDHALAALAGASRRAADVVRLCRQARARLAPDWYDEADLAAAAVDATVVGDPVVANVGHVVVHLVQEVTRHQARLLRAVGDRWPTSVVAATTGSPTADAGVQRSLDRLGCKPTGTDRAPRPVPAGSRLGGDGETTGTEATPEAAWPVSPGRTRLLTASDSDDEVRAAVRAVVDAARQGTPLERIAILYGSAEPYGRLLHEHLAAAGVPRNGTAVRPLAASAVGRVTSDLLALPDHRFRRGDVMGLLARTAVRTPAGAPAPVNEWERLSREAGVVSGRPDWDERLAGLAAAIDQRADDLAPDPALLRAATGPDEGTTGGDAAPGPQRLGEVDDEDDDDAVVAAERQQRQSDHVRRRAGRARDLREVVLWLIDELATAADDAHRQRWATRARWLRRLTDTLMGDADRRDAWPADEHRAADKVDAALERLAALDAVDGPPSLDTFRRTLALELDADLGRVGRFGEGVLVAPLAFAPGLDLDLLVVVGLAEGTLPGVVRDDSLLPDGERRRTGGELPLRRDRVERDHRFLRAALAGADRHLLCAPRGDLRASNERVPSRWLLAVASTLAGAPLAADAFLAIDAPWVEHVPSYAHAVTHAAFPATEQDYRLRAGRAALDDPLAAAGAEVMRARRSGDFTRFDGNLAGLAVPTPADATTSATRLEQWATCPHAYLVRYLLGVDPVDDPERQLTITPIDKGSLVHEVLETFIRRVLERPPGDQPGPDDPWTADDHRAMAEIAARACDDYEARGLTGRPVFWRRDRAQVLALADRFLREDERFRRATRARPVAAEFTFGRQSEDEGAVEVPLDDGRTLRFSGAIDRLDLADDGTIVVSDYKTGRATSYANLSPDDPDKRGTRLQLAVYALAARQIRRAPDAAVRSDYWFVSDREGFARKGYVVDDAVLARVRSVLTTITRGIERGIFPARPEDTGGGYVRCQYCDPDGMGVTELRRDWEHLREHPDVALYADLAEPRLGDDEPAGTDDAPLPGSAAVPPAPRDPSAPSGGLGAPRALALPAPTAEGTPDDHAH
jgi:ATP-dependent helicase/nuclease subunit B